MPCAACGDDKPGMEMHSDPLRWELDPPCTENEWFYLAEMEQAPEIMETQKCGYMNKICRRCYSGRLEILGRVKSRIRSRGGLENCGPTARMKREYEAAHEGDFVANRPARLQGLQSAAASALNGQFCKLINFDSESKRWTVELLDSGDKKAIKEENLEVSKVIDEDYEKAKLDKMLKDGPKKSMTGKVEGSEDKRPLGAKTAWPKVKGIHPGAVVRLQGLQGAAHLNGRKGRCLTFDPETGRWKVDLGDEHKALKVENLIPAPGEKPPTKASAAEEKQETEARQAKIKESPKEAYAESYGWDG